VQGTGENVAVLGRAMWMKCGCAMHGNVDEMWLCYAWQCGWNVAVLGMVMWMKCGCARHGNVDEMWLC